MQQAKKESFNFLQEQVTLDWPVIPCFCDFSIRIIGYGYISVEFFMDLFASFGNMKSEM